MATRKDDGITAAERRTIGHAFSMLRALASQATSNGEHRLDEALRYERRERSSADVARALLCESALDGIAAERDGGWQPSRLYSYSDGCRDAFLLGAELAAWAERSPARPLALSYRPDELLDDALRAARDAWRATYMRRAEAIK